MKKTIILCLILIMVLSQACGAREKTVDIVIPESIASLLTQGGEDITPEDSEITVTNNDDGSLTISLTESHYREWKNEAKTKVQETLDGLKDAVPYIERAELNESFSELSIFVNKEEYEKDPMTLSLSSLGVEYGLLLYQSMYEEGDPVCTTNIIDGATDKVIQTTTFPKDEGNSANLTDGSDSQSTSSGSTSDKEDGSNSSSETQNTSTALNENIPLGDYYAISIQDNEGTQTDFLDAFLCLEDEENGYRYTAGNTIEFHYSYDGGKFTLTTPYGEKASGTYDDGIIVLDVDGHEQIYDANYTAPDFPATEWTAISMQDDDGNYYDLSDPESGSFKIVFKPNGKGTYYLELDGEIASVDMSWEQRGNAIIGVSSEDDTIEGLYSGGYLYAYIGDYQYVFDIK